VTVRGVDVQPGPETESGSPDLLDTEYHTMGTSSRFSSIEGPTSSKRAEGSKGCLRGCAEAGCLRRRGQCLRWRRFELQRQKVIGETL
jgi:hypothetical protein